MPAPLGGLSFAVQAAHLAAEGLSGRAAMSMLRETGFSFTDRTFWNEWRADVGYEKGTWLAARQREDAPPPASLVQRKGNYPWMGYTYRYTVRVWDQETLTSRLETRQVGIEQRLTIAEARAVLQERIGRSEDRSGGVTEVLLFSGAMRGALSDEE